MNDRASASMAKGGVPDPLIGRTVNDRFRITALIARGGMGKVYRAEQSPLGRVCAVKILNPSYAGEHDPEFHKRFFLEASIASKLTHPNTVTIFDYGRTDDDIYYMAMEYLVGHTLHRAIRESGHFPEDRVAHIGRQVCRALREAHGLGVIHRDLKPANIFLVEHGDETDFVKVLDFGLVKNINEKGEDLTQTGLFMGSPKYMSPEQIKGDNIDARTDVYSLGIILYEMLTGKVPFDRPNSVNTLMAHVNDPPPPMRSMNPAVQVSEAFEETVMACLAKNADDRFRTMDELLAALKRVGTTLAGTVSGSGATGEYIPPGSGALATAGRTSRSSVPGMQPENGAPAFAASAAPSFLSPSGSHPGLSASPVPSVPPPVPSVPMASLGPPQGRPTAMLVLSLLAGLGVVGVLGYIALRSANSGNAAGAQPPVAAGPPATTVTAGVATAPPPAATVVTVRITTEPEGAMIREEGVERCSSTPCDVTYTGADADAAKDHKLAVTKPGYKSETRVVRVADSPVQVKLTAEARRYFAPQPTPTKAEAPSAPTVPTGYKTDVPY